MQLGDYFLYRDQLMCAVNIRDDGYIGAVTIAGDHHYFGPSATRQLTTLPVVDRPLRVGDRFVLGGRFHTVTNIGQEIFIDARGRNHYDLTTDVSNGDHGFVNRSRAATIAPAPNRYDVNTGMSIGIGDPGEPRINIPPSRTSSQAISIQDILGQELGDTIRTLSQINFPNLPGDMDRILNIPQNVQDIRNEVGEIMSAINSPGSRDAMVLPTTPNVVTTPPTFNIDELPLVVTALGEGYRNVKAIPFINRHHRFPLGVHDDNDKALYGIVKLWTGVIQKANMGDLVNVIGCVWLPTSTGVLSSELQFSERKQFLSESLAPGWGNPDVATFPGHYMRRRVLERIQATWTAALLMAANYLLIEINSLLAAIETRRNALMSEGHQYRDVSHVNPLDYGLVDGKPARQRRNVVRPSDRQGVPTSTPPATSLKPNDDDSDYD